MKLSKRTIAILKTRLEKKKGGKPVVSKYSAKVRSQFKEGN